MKFTIDVIKENVESLNLFFHSFEHDGKKIDPDPGVVQKLGIAVRNAIRSTLFVPVVNTIGEIKEELQKKEAKSKTKINIEMELGDAMLIMAALDSDNKIRPPDSVLQPALKKMETQVDNIVEAMNSTDEQRFH